MRDHYSAVTPILLKRPSPERFRHPIQDQSDLVLCDAGDENAPGVRSPFLGRRSQEIVSVLEQSGRLRSGLTTTDALDVMWAMTSPDTYTKFVFQRRWQPDRFEEWLASALIDLLLERSGHVTGDPRADRRWQFANT